MKIRSTATLTINFIDDDDIQKVNEVKKLGLTYRDIFMSGVELLLDKNKNSIDL